MKATVGFTSGQHSFSMSIFKFSRHTTFTGHTLRPKTLDEWLRVRRVGREGRSITYWKTKEEGEGYPAPRPSRPLQFCIYGPGRASLGVASFLTSFSEGPSHGKFRWRLSQVPGSGRARHTWWPTWVTRASTATTPPSTTAH